MRSVLVVEDDSATRTTFVEILEMDGYQVHSAKNGIEAFAFLNSGAPIPSLIILDVNMPGMDGVEFRRQQSLNSRLRDVPVVVVSAEILCGEPRTLFASAKYLRKPVEIKNFLEIVNQLCA